MLVYRAGCCSIPRPNQYLGFFNSYWLFPIKYLDHTFSWLGGPCRTGSLMSSRRHKKVGCHETQTSNPGIGDRDVPGISRKLRLSIVVDNSLIPFSTRWSSQFESWRYKKLTDYAFVVRNAFDARRAKVCDNTLPSAGHSFLHCEKYFFRKPASIKRKTLL